MTALESGWPCMAASLESLTVVQVLTVTVTTYAIETIAKVFRALAQFAKFTMADN